MRGMRKGLVAGTTGLAVTVVLGAQLWAPGVARAELNGKILIERKGCLTCHSLLGQGGRMGPPLQSTPSWSPPDRMRQYILDPKSVNPKSIMPPSRLTDEEVDAMVAYLQSFKGEAKAPEGWKGE
jgi:mono/diheme cytochrome c family protein